MAITLTPAHLAHAADRVRQQAQDAGLPLVTDEPRPLTLPEVIAAMRARGYTHVLTGAGPLPLEAWHPYGYGRDLPPNPDYRLQIIGPDRARDLPRGPVQAPMALGVWAFTTKES